MTDAITRKHQIISTGFLNKIKFPSDYEGDRKKFHSWGYGCNECPACLLRSKGWKKFIKND